MESVRHDKIIIYAVRFIKLLWIIAADKRNYTIIFEFINT